MIVHHILCETHQWTLHLASTPGATIQVPSHVVTSLNLFARYSNELELHYLKMGHQESSASNGHQGDIPYYSPSSQVSPICPWILHGSSHMSLL